MLATFPVHYTISLYLIYFMLSSLYLISLEKLTSAIGYSDDHDYSDYMVPVFKGICDISSHNSSCPCKQDLHAVFDTQRH